MLWKSFLSLHDVWVQKCKYKLFEENKRFEFIFYRIEVQGPELKYLLKLKKDFLSIDISTF